MANIKFSAFTELAPIDQGINGSYIVGYEGDANTNNRWTFGEVAIGLKAVTATPYSIYSASGTLEATREVTFSAHDLKFIATGNGKLWYQDSNQALGKVLKSDANGKASWGAETDTTYNVFTGADGSNPGTTGLVPQPAAADNVKFLTGAATWATPTNTTYSTFTYDSGAPANSTSGLVPAPTTSGDNTKFLRGDGTWVTPTDTTDNIYNTSSNLTADRTVTMNNVAADTPYNLTFAGINTSKVTFSNSGGVQFDEDVTFVKNTIIQGQAYTELNSLSNTLTVNWNNSNVQTISGLTGSHTFTPTNPKAGATYILTLVQTGAVTATWGSYIKWAAPDSAATPPELSGANKTDVITLICWSATANSGAGGYYGSITKDLS